MATPHITVRNGKTILIPDATMLADVLNDLPAGERTDLGVVRRELALKHGVDATCPVTTQRLLVQFRIDGDVPYWRVVDPERPFARCHSGDADCIRGRPAAEM